MSIVNKWVLDKNRVDIEISVLTLILDLNP